MRKHPCKHLDYETTYGPDITLENCGPDYPEIRYWLRGPTWTDTGPGEEPNPATVQFCKKYGRIKGIFQCYTPGELPCYEPASEERLFAMKRKAPGTPISPAAEVAALREALRAARTCLEEFRRMAGAERFTAALEASDGSVLT